MLNYKTPSVKISDFKNKLLILDFWDIWCGTCIAAMPKMHKLQEEFGDDIIILPVTAGKEVDIKSFSEKNPVLSQLDFYSAVEDSTLSQLFPHKMVPHVVWIDGDGIVKAITGSGEVNEDNIKAVLKGDVALKEKKDVLDYDHNLPLLIGNNGADESFFLQRSVITPKIDGISTMFGGPFVESDSSVRFRATNVSLINIYSLAYKDLSRLPKSRIVLEVKDKTMYLNPAFLKRQDKQMDTEAEEDAIWCYDLITKGDKPIDQIRKFIKNDLDLFFGLDGRMEKRTIKCLVLKKNNQFTDTERKIDGNSYKLSAFVYKYNNIVGNHFIVNESEGYNPSVAQMDVEIGIEELKANLLKYGIICEKEEREMDVFVLTEIDGTSL
ncbi:TlpA family protein disulfide reductase [Sphingobacterium sp. CZ-2]|uniref:TlpA family protein disulfide reductase n=1 Tax=Sphingobacterium sp. CZ-2 TaxID=2557994 RepID=UPI001430F2B1|nr:TlpA disulfide reductase family protein [Sphingobacterium sp. CZ-2]